VVVWIEMMASAPGTCGHCVTTCVVVWIEINFRVSELLIILSPPAWWCGLKSADGKTGGLGKWSPPAWWCGLKSLFLQLFHGSVQSPPAWWCGLKLVRSSHGSRDVGVTTCVVVWIEIRFRALNH